MSQFQQVMGPEMAVSWNEMEEMKLPKLVDSRGFTTWSRKMCLEFDSRDLLEYIEEVEDGGIPDPRERVQEHDPNGTKEERDQYEKWKAEVLAYKKRDSKVLRILGKSVSSEFEPIIYQGGNARDTFRRLKSFFQQKSLQRSRELTTLFNNMSLMEGSNMWKYLSDFQTILTELKIIGIEKSELEITSQILDGLPASYDTIVQSVMRETSISQKDLVQLLLSEETRRQRMALRRKGLNLQTTKKQDLEVNGMEQIESVKKVTHQGKARFQGRCHHCKKKGHKKDQCWELHGKTAKGDNSPAGNSVRTAVDLPS